MHFRQDFAKYRTQKVMKVIVWSNILSSNKFSLNFIWEYYILNLVLFKFMLFQYFMKVLVFYKRQQISSTFANSINLPPSIFLKIEM